MNNADMNKGRRNTAARRSAIWQVLWLIGGVALALPLAALAVALTGSAKAVVVGPALVAPLLARRMEPTAARYWTNLHCRESNCTNPTYDLPRLVTIVRC